MRQQTYTMSRFVATGILALISLLTSILYSPTVSAGTNQCTWTGGGVDDNWSTAANWSCSVGTVPATGYDIIFPYLSTNEPTLNDLSASNVYSGIWFTGTIPNDCNYGVYYDIDGNQIQLAGDINVQPTNGCGKNIVINQNVVFTADASITIDSVGSEVSLGMPGGINIGNHTVTVDSQAPLFGVSTGYISIGSLTGNGIISSDGQVTLSGDNTLTFSGNINHTNGTLYIAGTALGSTTGTTTVGNNANILFGSCASGMTVGNNLVFNGTAYTASTAPGTITAKLVTTYGCGGGFADEWYEAFYGNHDIDINGNITTNTDMVVSPIHNLNINGNISGSGFGFSLAYDPDTAVVIPGGYLNINSSVNNSNTSNGSYRNPVRTVTLADTLPASTVYVGALHEVTITGTRSDVQVLSEGLLKGTGTVGWLAANSGGTINPGMSPGVMTATGGLTLTSGSVLEVELEGTSLGQYDQLDVTGAVDVTGATLTPILFNGYVPSIVGDSYTIINNDGADAVTGTFNGLSEGGEITVGATKFTISYVGGDGNDVVLTASYIPGPPGTGFDVYKQDAALYAGIAIASLIAVVVLRKKVASLHR